MRKPWRAAFVDALVSGSLAAVASTVALAALGKAEAGSAFGPTNATSRWVHGDRAARRDGPSGRYTLVGYAIHHGASLFWATFYDVGSALGGIAATSPRRWVAERWWRRSHASSTTG